MEALANEGMPVLLLLQYWDNQEITTAIDDVSQNPDDIPHSGNAYEDRRLSPGVCAR
jgi:hypothetical protein